MLTAQGGRLLIQGVYFVLLARVFGVEQFGMYMGSAALVSVFFPFSGIGAGNVLIQEVARKPSSLPVYWGNALLLSGVSGIGFAAILGFAGAWLLPTVPVTLVITLAFAELVFGRMIETVGQIFQALERLDRTAQLNIGLGATRMAAALCFVAMSQNVSPAAWGYWYLSASAVVALSAGVIAARQYGVPRMHMALLVSKLKQGLYFSIGMASQSIYAEIDKTMLARISTFDDTGIYSAATRVIGLAFAPIRSLLYSTYARFFRQGQAGLAGTLLLVRRFLPFSVAYGLVVGGVLYITAPLIPFVLGDGYHSAVNAIRWLALVPLCQGIHYFLADALTGAGYQGARTTNQIVTALFNVLLNLVLIPRYSWRGAALATLLSEATLGLLLWVTIKMIRARTRGDRHDK